jgi:hypothetical protein
MSIRRINQFWSVSLEHIPFLYFLKLFVKMHLAICFARKKIVFFGPTDQKLLVLFLGEVRAGQACARANEEELTTCMGAGGRSKGAGGGARKGDPWGPGRRPAVGRYRSRPDLRLPTAGRP